MISSLDTITVTKITTIIHYATCSSKGSKYGEKKNYDTTTTNNKTVFDGVLLINVQY